MKVQHITHYLEQIAPRSLQESYDNAGLITGSPQQEVTGVLTSLDCLEATVEEAVQTGCNLIVAHHPIVFKGLKKLTGANYIERTVIKAIKHDIAIYAIHTNLDHVHNGVNAEIARKLNLQQTSILLPKEGQLCKLVTFVPVSEAEQVFSALSAAGAGAIGNYDQCSFQQEGTGTFRPNQDANPHIGKRMQLEKVSEMRLEMLLPVYLQQKVLAALRQAHPYEEVAYYLQPLQNEHQLIGSGMIGQLPEPLSSQAFLQYLKNKMELEVIRFTPFGQTIHTIAVCGGSGSFVLPAAKAKGAQALVTADFKYHEFFDAETNLMIADIGHFESEKFTIGQLQRFLAQQFPDLTVKATTVNTNPVRYFY